MATKKKTAAKGVGDSTPTIIRNYDLQSMDKRLRNMEGDTVIPRNYDIYSMEERIHQLEVNGGGGSAVIESLSITPSKSAQTFNSDEVDGYKPVTVSAVTASIDANIVSGNIKKDVEILGVTGTYEGEGSAQFATGTFTSANTQYGITSVNVGFQPDFVFVILPIGNGDTVSWWSNQLNYGNERAPWCINPTENAFYNNLLDRTTGESGIQSITSTGFTFLVNSGNTRNQTCKYVAVKF